MLASSRAGEFSIGSLFGLTHCASCSTCLHSSQPSAKGGIRKKKICVPYTTCLAHIWKHTPAERRVPGLPIRDCTRGCNNCGPTQPKLSAIDVTGNTFFERLHLVLGFRKFAPWVNCPYAPTTPTIHCTTISRFLCNFFPRMTPQSFLSIRFTK